MCVLVGVFFFSYHAFEASSHLTIQFPTVQKYLCRMLDCDSEVEDVPHHTKRIPFACAVLPCKSQPNDDNTVRTFGGSYITHGQAESFRGSASLCAFPYSMGVLAAASGVLCVWLLTACLRRSDEIPCLCIRAKLTNTTHTRTREHLRNTRTRPPQIES